MGLDSVVDRNVSWLRHLVPAEPARVPGHRLTGRVPDDDHEFEVLVLAPAR